MTTAAAGTPWVELYRPKSLEDVSHQTEVIATLQNAVETGRMPHLLFYGPPGSGKVCLWLYRVRVFRVLDLTRSSFFLSLVFFRHRWHWHSVDNCGIRRIGNDAFWNSMLPMKEEFRWFVKRLNTLPVSPLENRLNHNQSHFSKRPKPTTAWRLTRKTRNSTPILPLKLSYSTKQIRSLPTHKRLCVELLYVMEHNIHAPHYI